jgi:hypothetical protein
MNLVKRTAVRGKNNAIRSIYSPTEFGISSTKSDLIPPHLNQLKQRQHVT